ncbi:Hypothetical protein D9617_79g062250 [Elsinoe fawcettii]|nr:Hypothetical protein D9617_79g062250 [Elsinoe fawcettii]
MSSEYYASAGPADTTHYGYTQGPAVTFGRNTYPAPDDANQYGPHFYYDVPPVPPSGQYDDAQPRTTKGEEGKVIGELVMGSGFEPDRQSSSSSVDPVSVLEGVLQNTKGAVAEQGCTIVKQVVACETDREPASKSACWKLELERKHHEPNMS